MRHIIYSLSLVICSSAWSATPLLEPQLQEQLAPYQNIKKMRASFEQTRSLRRWNTSIKTSGFLKFDKAQKTEIIWEITKPEYSAIKFSEQTLSVKSSKESKKWKILKNPNLNKQLDPLFAWLSFDSKKIAKSYTVFSEEKDNFKLIPKDKKSPLENIQIKGHNGVVKQVILTEKTNDQIKIVFKTLELKK